MVRWVAEIWIIAWCHMVVPQYLAPAKQWQHDYKYFGPCTVVVVVSNYGMRQSVRHVVYDILCSDHVSVLKLLRSPPEEWTSAKYRMVRHVS